MSTSTARTRAIAAVRANQPPATIFSSDEAPGEIFGTNVFSKSVMQKRLPKPVYASLMAMERSFGFHHVRSTSAIAAPWFVGAALGLEVLSTFYVDREPFLIGRVTVLPDGGLVGLAMRDLSSRVRVIAISRNAHEGQLEHPPRRGTRFATGDSAYLLGPYEELLAVLKRNKLSLSEEHTAHTDG